MMIQDGLLNLLKGPIFLADSSQGATTPNEVNAPVELNRKATTESGTSDENSATPLRLPVCGNWLAIANA